MAIIAKPYVSVVLVATAKNDYIMISFGLPGLPLGYCWSIEGS